MAKEKTGRSQRQSLSHARFRKEKAGFPARHGRRFFPEKITQFSQDVAPGVIYDYGPSKTDPLEQRADKRAVFRAAMNDKPAKKGIATAGAHKRPQHLGQPEERIGKSVCKSAPANGLRQGRAASGILVGKLAVRLMPIQEKIKWQSAPLIVNPAQVVNNPSANHGCCSIQA